VVFLVEYVQLHLLLFRLVILVFIITFLTFLLLRWNLVDTSDITSPVLLGSRGLLKYPESFDLVLKRSLEFSFLLPDHKQHFVISLNFKRVLVFLNQVDAIELIQPESWQFEAMVALTRELTHSGSGLRIEAVAGLLVGVV